MTDYSVSAHWSRTGCEASSRVLVVLSPGTPRPCWQGRPGLGQQPGGTLIEADHLPLEVLGFGAKFQDILHVGHEHMWATNSMLTLGMHHCCFTTAFYDLALEASVPRDTAARALFMCLRWGATLIGVPTPGPFSYGIFSLPWDNSVPEKQTEPFYHIYGRFDTLFPRNLR